MNQEHKYQIPYVDIGRTIPKIVHQTFPNKTLPKNICDNLEKLKQNNPEWKFVLYDDDDINGFILDEYGDYFLSIYQSISKNYGAARADLFRYLLIYKNGGVYLDIKSTVVLSLDEVVKRTPVYALLQWDDSVGNGHENWGMHNELNEVDGGEFIQWCLISVPGHPFLREVIKQVIANINNYNPYVHGRGRMGVLRVTGPIAYTKSIYPLLGLYKHDYYRKHSYCGLVYSIFGIDNDKAHRGMFKYHYAVMTSPVIEQNFIRKIINIIFKLKIKFFGQA
jgi:mannosyltransferase OCH1-like enzyme